MAPKWKHHHCASECYNTCEPRAFKNRSQQAEAAIQYFHSRPPIGFLQINSNTKDKHKTLSRTQIPGTYKGPLQKYSKWLMFWEFRACKVMFLLCKLCYWLVTPKQELRNKVKGWVIHSDSFHGLPIVQLNVANWSPFFLALVHGLCRAMV